MSTATLAPSSPSPPSPPYAIPLMTGRHQDLPRPSSSTSPPFSSSFRVIRNQVPVHPVFRCPPIFSLPSGTASFQSVDNSSAFFSSIQNAVSLKDEVPMRGVTGGGICLQGGVQPSSFPPHHPHNSSSSSSSSSSSVPQFRWSYTDSGSIPAATYPYGSIGYGLHHDVRRKNATRESTNTLKAWLYEHIKNPYPTKGEKIMLAIITKMTLTQVSTWFANARRRLKKENKMEWSPKQRTDDEEDDEEDERERISCCSDVRDNDDDVLASRDDVMASHDSRSAGGRTDDENDDVVVDSEDDDLDEDHNRNYYTSTATVSSRQTMTSPSHSTTTSSPPSSMSASKQINISAHISEDSIVTDVCDTELRLHDDLLKQQQQQEIDKKLSVLPEQARRTTTSSYSTPPYTSLTPCPESPTTPVVLRGKDTDEGCNGALSSRERLERIKGDIVPIEPSSSAAAGFMSSKKNKPTIWCLAEMATSSTISSSNLSPNSSISAASSSLLTTKIVASDASSGTQALRTLTSTFNPRTVQGHETTSTSPRSAQIIFRQYEALCNAGLSAHAQSQEGTLASQAQASFFRDYKQSILQQQFLQQYQQQQQQMMIQQRGLQLKAAAEELTWSSSVTDRSATLLR